jgi:hypothetical protein
MDYQTKRAVFILVHLTQTTLQNIGGFFSVWSSGDFPRGSELVLVLSQIALESPLKRSPAILKY